MEKDRKDGKPYISTIYCKESGVGTRYVEAKKTELTICKDESYDFVITCVGLQDQNVTYYIAQSEDVYISSSTGTFSTKDIYDKFLYNVDVYAYAIAGDGTRTEAQQIKLVKDMELSTAAKNFLDSPTISVFGDDGISYTIPDSALFFGGTKFSLDSLQTPLTIDITGTRIKIAVGLDWDALKKANGDEFEFTNFYESFKKQFKTAMNSFDKADTSSNRYGLLRSLRDKYGIASTSESKLKIAAEVLGYIEAELNSGQIIITDMMISVGGELKYNYQKQLATEIGPVYVTVGFDLPVNGEFTKGAVVDDPKVRLGFELVMNVEPSLRLAAGYGIKDIVSAGIYGKGTIPVSVDFPNTHFTLDVKGKFGLEAEFFVLKADISLWEGESTVVDTYWGNHAVAAMSLAKNADSQTANNATYTIADRNYTENTSEWLGTYPGISTFSASEGVSGIDLRVLQTGIYSQSQPQPQITAFGDSMIMVWIEDDTSRDTYNRMRLMYSVYDPKTDTWSEGKPVCDDGHNDAYPSLASDGTNVYVAGRRSTRL